ncbi:LysM peptidoglycan-binding domain-containing protein [Desulfobotulus mexicanus]|uniref:LysM peptidoglycan-binding domain-containing protein n=1 Tax=Desulfobotulus mexicanus TaxID=2586642 RepID=A0A5Q4VEZ6_9BACT|nr:LysM domain-containing protein [Desulfobotulus mexicanus]TYT75548.1 LysM peptidoglycan-binding domain-containing protein [Desulfobotulus mexicanus]
MDPKIRSNLEAAGQEESGFGPPSGRKTWYRSVEMPFVWLGAGLVAVLILFLIFFPGRSQEPVFPSGVGSGAEYAEISERLDRLASTLESLRMQRMFSESGAPEQEELVSVIRKMNADFSLQIAALSKKMDGLQSAVEAQSRSVAPAIAPPKTAETTDGDAALKTRRSSTTKMDPASSAVTSPSAGGLEYSVQRGDTLFSIARKHGVTLGSLLEVNRMKQSDPIHPGQRLKIPE